MECSDLTRTGVAGLDGHFIINIDHHAGNRMYGAINWFDESAAACGEMVFDIIKALGVPLSAEIATHIYLAILTDTGSFHHSNITPRTFEICRQAVEAGVNPAIMARRVYDSNSFGKLKLIGALLDEMELVDGGRLAVLRMDDAVLAACGCTQNDTEGIINLPLTAREIQAVVFFKMSANGDVRVSMRSKYDVDVRVVASEFGGGGHKNAAGFTVAGQARGRSAPHRRSARKGRRRRAGDTSGGMNGVLVVDKPSGPTSHDVVGRVRRALGTRRVGHTGTLDPLATGVLPLVIGRATRLAQFLSSDEKEYVADVAFGVSTSTYDALGSELPHEARCPRRSLAVGWRARRVPRHVPPDAACILREESLGEAGVRACSIGSGARAQAGTSHGHGARGPRTG